MHEMQFALAVRGAGTAAGGCGAGVYANVQAGTAAVGESPTYAAALPILFAGAFEEALIMH